MDTKGNTGYLLFGEVRKTGEKIVQNRVKS